MESVRVFIIGGANFNKDGISKRDKTYLDSRKNFSYEILPENFLPTLKNF